MSTIKIKVGTLALAQERDVELPQEFAAWHQTVRIAPGTYDVHAYLEWDHDHGGHRVRSLSAECEGITISSNFRAHMLGSWGKSDNNRNGKHATAHVHLPTYGMVGEPSILAQATLCDALVRVEWDPRDHDPRSTAGLMWRFIWNAARKPIVIESPRYGGLSLAAFEDHRRFRVDSVEMSPAEVNKLDLHFQHFFNVDQLTVGETASGWSWSDKRSLQITRLA